MFKNNELLQLKPLVWSHFCLCYQNQKLINDKACIQSYGIRDGDQLHFIQHLRIDNAPIETVSKYQIAEFKQRSTVLACETKEDASIANQNSNLKNFYCEEENLAFPKAKSTLADRFIELISRSKFPGWKSDALGGRILS
ncbi:hypothetical protein F511_22603 [Dorcoceras hygrometricum]|uniref:SNRNP25 ubiquitin-like domain-containing protein n=1 Tax=Dorcoceras hygrometricum TaxID=472368 RepID=A0A2Z7CAD4_9LAMI|nr:hypothetical protein F511_22603 [Dorcoceras hygrometricum]